MSSAGLSESIEETFEDESAPPPSLDRPPLLWPGLRGLLGGVFAVVAVLLLQVVVASYYWLADPSVSVALTPTWDIPVLVLLLVVCGALGLPRWASRTLVIALSLIVFFYLVLGVGQGFALREFGYDVVLALHASYVPELFRMMYGGEPLGWFIFYVALLATGTLLLGMAIFGSVRHLLAFSCRGRRRQLGLAAGMLAGFGLGAALLGVNGPVTAEAYTQLDLAINLKERLNTTAGRLDMEAAKFKRMNPFVKASERPTILVFVVESYGEVLFSDPDFAGFPSWMEEKGKRLTDVGYHASSRLMHAPVFGGSSWLAQSTLMCGVRIYNQKRYQSLFSSTVRCLPAMLNDAGYRTVVAAPNTKYLEDTYASKLPFDKYYFKPDYGYKGPRMGWSFMPDQFAIDFVHRREIAPRLAGTPTEPLFLAYFLTSSHHPWGVIPPYIEDWSRIGDGTIYNEVAATEYVNRFSKGAAYKPAYRTSVEYALRSVVDYLAALPQDDRSLVILLGDHQPRRPIATMKQTPWYVPIHVLSRDPAAVARFAKLGYQPGFTPKKLEGEPSGMERFMQELFVAYGSSGR